MACSICGGHGHNKRTCIARKLQESGLPDHVKDHVVNYLTDGISDEALIFAIETGADIAIPGLGTSIRLGRYAWRYLH